MGDLQVVSTLPSFLATARFESIRVKTQMCLEGAGILSRAPQWHGTSGTSAGRPRVQINLDSMAVDAIGGLWL